MKRALVTGATGFIGSHLVRRLVRRGFRVHALCRPRSSFHRLADVRDRLTVHTVSLADRRGLHRLVRAVAPDYVLHLAAATMHGGAAAAPDEIVRTNLLGTVNLLDACDDIDYACFVNTGDSFEYGPRRRPLRESQRCGPTTLDGITKLASTLYAQQLARTHQRPIVTLRLFSVFGPHDAPRRLVPQVIANALAGTPLLLSRPRIARDFLHVDDVVDLYSAVMRRAGRLGGEVLNAGSGRQTTIREIVDTVLALTGSSSEVRWNTFPTAAHDLNCWVADMSRTRALVPWQPRMGLETGLAATIRFTRGRR